MFSENTFFNYKESVKTGKEQFLVLKKMLLQ